LKKFLNLTEPETFNSKATDSVIEKLKDKTAIKESKYIDPLSDTNEQIKQKVVDTFLMTLEPMFKNIREKNS